jgi:hypothetical protein
MYAAMAMLLAAVSNGVSNWVMSGWSLCCMVLSLSLYVF